MLISDIIKIYVSASEQFHIYPFYAAALVLDPQKT